MAHTVRVIARPGIVPGFALAGLPALEVADAIEAGQQVRAAREGGVGVLLIEERLYDALADEVRREGDRRDLPMLVPFPSPTWAAPAVAAEAYIVELLRRAIGYRVRLR